MDENEFLIKTQKFNTMELVQLDEEIEEVINTESQ